MNHIEEIPIWFAQRVCRSHVSIKLKKHKVRPISEFDRDALFSLPADDYDDWISTGMACKESFGENGFSIWSEWSKTSSKFRDIEDCRKKWHSFQVERQNAIAFASVIFRAKQAGWSPRETIGKNLEKISKAVANGSEVDATALRTLFAGRMPAIDRANLPAVKRTQTGHISSVALTAITNVEKALTYAGVQVKYNAFSHEYEICFVDSELQTLLGRFSKPQEMARALVWQLGQEVGFGNRQDFEDVVCTLATDASFHPVEDWITSCAWDGVDRISELAATVTLKDFPRELWRIYLRRWLIQGVQACCGRRAPQQLRGCLVFSGPQNCGKTTWFSKLLPMPGAYKAGVALAQFGGSINPDSIKLATSAFITELGELETTFSKASAGALKNFLTASWDEYRLPYGRSAIRHPRTTIFCGTVNHLNFLRDSSGSTRFWPVQVESCDAFHDIDMQQVWAQAYDLWKSGEGWFLSAHEEGLRQGQSERFIERTAADEVVDEFFHLYGKLDRENWQALSLREIAELLNLPFGNRERGELRTALIRHTRTDARQIGGRRRAWLIPQQTISKKP